MALRCNQTGLTSIDTWDILVAYEWFGIDKERLSCCTAVLSMLGDELRLNTGSRLGTSKASQVRLPAEICVAIMMSCFNFVE